MVTWIFVYIHLCYFSHEGSLSQIESNLSGLRKKGKHNDPAFGPFNKAALHII